VLEKLVRTTTRWFRYTHRKHTGDMDIPLIEGREIQGTATCNFFAVRFNDKDARALAG